MKTVNEKNEILFTNLEEHFMPRENFSPYSLKNKWRVVPVGTAEYDGNMIASYGGRPDNITFSPELKGWYKIYIHTPGGSMMNIKLTSDPAFLAVATYVTGINNMEEMLWRCADMTGESITLTKKKDGDTRHTMLAAIKFVPRTEEEVAGYMYEEKRQDTKRIYATDDMHNRFCFANQETYEDWLPTALNYYHSDVEWLSIEQIRTFVSERLPVDDIDEFCFPRQCDKNVQMNRAKFDYDKVLRMVVDEGHRMGLKMSVSFRMGAWGMTYPYDQFYFDCDFMEEHPELRTYDRNGDEIRALSYAYPEVRAFLINEFLNMARSGCDAVTLIAHRGIPYVLFEKPVADKFYELYGEYPYELPLDEPRLSKLHCDIMTGFMRELREALDKEFGKGKIEIHLRSLYSLRDNLNVGIDAEQWAREGLVNAIVSYPQRHYERLEGDIWQEGKEYRIDLEKYTKFAHTVTSVTVHGGDFDQISPYKNYNGRLLGPEDQAARVREWMDIERKYGVKMYFEILPRQMTCEKFKERALALYDCGAERLGLWDTYTRVPAKDIWSTASKLGHKDELRDMPVGQGHDYRLFRIYKIAKADINRYNPMWGG